MQAKYSLPYGIKKTSYARCSDFTIWGKTVLPFFFSFILYYLWDLKEINKPYKIATFSIPHSQQFKIM